MTVSDWEAMVMPWAELGVLGGAILLGFAAWWAWNKGYSVIRRG